jgi:hypothetical protein
MATGQMEVGCQGGNFHDRASTGRTIMHVSERKPAFLSQLGDTVSALRRVVAARLSP